MFNFIKIFDNTLLAIDWDQVYIVILIISSVILLVLNIVNIKVIIESKKLNWLDRIPIDLFGKDGFFYLLRKNANQDSIDILNDVYEEYHTQKINHYKYINEKFYENIYNKMELFFDKLLIKINSKQEDKCISVINEFEYALAEDIYNFQITNSFKHKKRK